MIIGNSFNYEKGPLQSIDFSIDELKIFNKELKIYEIQASAEIFLGGISPTFYKLSCLQCEYT
jgi:hypothetical protein